MKNNKIIACVLAVSVLSSKQTKAVKVMEVMGVVFLAYIGLGVTTGVAAVSYNKIKERLDRIYILYDSESLGDKSKRPRKIEKKIEELKKERRPFVIITSLPNDRNRIEFFCLFRDGYSNNDGEYIDIYEFDRNDFRKITSPFSSELGKTNIFQLDKKQFCNLRDIQESKNVSPVERILLNPNSVSKIREQLRILKINIKKSLEELEKDNSALEFQFFQKKAFWEVVSISFYDSLPGLKNQLNSSIDLQKNVNDTKLKTIYSTPEQKEKIPIIEKTNIAQKYIYINNLQKIYEASVFGTDIKGGKDKIELESETSLKEEESLKKFGENLLIIYQNLLEVAKITKNSLDVAKAQEAYAKYLVHQEKNKLEAIKPESPISGTTAKESFKKAAEFYGQAKENMDEHPFLSSTIKDTNQDLVKDAVSSELDMWQQLCSFRSGESNKETVIDKLKNCSKKFKEVGGVIFKTLSLEFELYEVLFEENENVL